MNKKYFFRLVIIILLVVVISLIITRANKQAKTNTNKKIKVITTLFPLYDMAQKIGADKANVSLLLPPGVEAHSFEPKPSDIIAINEADIFIYTGKFMEPWAEDILKTVDSKDLIVVDASQGTKMTSGIFHDADEQAGSIDPHIWLDFDNAEKMTENIKNAFTKKDSQNADFYSKNASAYDNRLTAIDNQYRATLSGCGSNKIVYAGHYAFGYLANRYGLKYLAAQAVSPDAEPTAADLVNLADQINKNKVKYLFYEELTSPKIAETIANETSAQMLLLNAAHNLAKDQFESGVSFFDILNSDLANLKIGLGCK